MASADTPPDPSLDGLVVLARSGLADQHPGYIWESPGKGVVVVR